MLKKIKSSNWKWYFRTTENKVWLVVKKWRYFDVVSWLKYKSEDLIYDQLEDDRANYLLDILEENNIRYMIHGFNNTYVVTKNAKWHQRQANWTAVGSWIIWWTRGINNDIFWDVYNNISRYGKYTVWSWNAFINFMWEALQWWNILKQSELKKYPPKSKWWWTSPQYKKERKIFVDFLIMLEELWNSWDDDSQDKLTDLYNRYKIDEIYDYIRMYREEPDKFEQKISCIYNENSYKLLATFKM